MRLDIINGLRGWAVIGVLLWHVPFHLAWTTHIPLGGEPEAFLSLHPTWPIGPVPLRPTAPLLQTWQAVNLFFFLSGFVLYLPYVNGQRTMTSWSDARAFYRVRAKRLLPLFAIFVLAMTFLDPKWEGLYYDIGTTLTFVYPFIPGDFYSRVAAPLWSLAPEVYFSLAFPAIVAAIRRFGFVPTVAVGCATALATRMVGACLPGLMLNDFMHPVSDSVFGRLDDFLLGMVCAVLYHRRWFARSEGAALALAGLGVGIWALGAYAWDLKTLWWVDGRPAIPDLARPFFNYAFNVGPIFLVLGLAHAGRSIRWVWTAAPVQLVGMMCYSIYLWHWPFTFVTTYREGGYDLDAESVLAFVVLTLGLSALSYRYIEFGSVADGRKLFRPLPPLPPPTTGGPTIDLPPEPMPERPQPAAGPVDTPPATTGGASASDRPVD